MDKKTYQYEITKAQTRSRLGDKPNYWLGYMRGVRRRFYGESFGTKEEHELWLGLINSTDESMVERGRGYPPVPG